MLGHSIKENTVGLSIFAVVTAGIIAFTQINTADKIDTNIALAKASTLHQIISEDRHDNDLLTDIILINDSSVVADDGPTEAFVARKKGKAVAIILPAITNNGYTGRISSLVGINADGTIAKVRVLTHQETPGLGDKVEVKKSGWVHQFESKSLNNPDITRWAVKKDHGDFDQLTGATITPRAIVKSVLASLQYFEANRDRLLAPLEQAAEVQNFPAESDIADSVPGQSQTGQ
jgi:electron transport complex protein RnfG